MKISLWFHIIGPAITLGSGLFFMLAFYPAFNSIEDKKERYRAFITAIKVFHPLLLTGLCISLLSGASQITDLKIGLGQDYFEVIGKPLIWKFGLTILMFIIGGIQSFGYGLPLTKMVNGLIEGTDDQKERFIHKIWWMNLINVLLIAVTIYLGLSLSRGLLNPE